MQRLVDGNFLKDRLSPTLQERIAKTQKFQNNMVLRNQRLHKGIRVFQLGSTNKGVERQ